MVKKVDMKQLFLLKKFEVLFHKWKTFNVIDVHELEEVDLGKFLVP